MTVNEITVLGSFVGELKEGPDVVLSASGAPALVSHVDVSAWRQELWRELPLPCKGSARLCIQKRGRREGTSVGELPMPASCQIGSSRRWAGSPPPLWDPLLGIYAIRDGWIRLHTNYANHRDALLGALGLAGDRTREQVSQVIADWLAEDLRSGGRRRRRMCRR